MGIKSAWQAAQQICQALLKRPSIAPSTSPGSGKRWVAFLEKISSPSTFTSKAPRLPLMS